MREVLSVQPELADHKVPIKSRRRVSLTLFDDAERREFLWTAFALISTSPSVQHCLRIPLISRRLSHLFVDVVNPEVRSVRYFTMSHQQQNFRFVLLPKKSVAPAVLHTTSATLSSAKQGVGIISAAANDNVARVTQPVGTFLTPAASHSSSFEQQPVANRRFDVKVRILGPGKRQARTFSMRKFDPCSVACREDLEDIFRDEFLSEIGDNCVSNLGYIKSGSKVWVRGEEDVKEVMTWLKRKGDITFWLALAEQKHGDSDSESDREKSAPKRKKARTQSDKVKVDRIECTIKQLQDLHKDKFSNLQYRLQREVASVIAPYLYRTQIIMTG